VRGLNKIKLEGRKGARPNPVQGRSGAPGKTCGKFQHVSAMKKAKATGLKFLVESGKKIFERELLQPRKREFQRRQGGGAITSLLTWWKQTGSKRGLFESIGILVEKGKGIRSGGGQKKLLILYK